ncbi:MAG: threonine/serine dehydratase [candidate division KSB1 bacterium]|nr:threonine/serine dehydratase [candidate division KSB1 bacterium]
MSFGFRDIEEAQSRIAGVVYRTPVLRSINERTDGAAEFFFKCENLQRSGAFKLRGAYNKIAALSEPVRRHGVVAFSSGNHARAVATAARLLGTHAKIVMPKDAPAVKLQATRAVGADIVLYDRYRESREAIAQAICENEHRTLVPPFDDPLIIAGQGTIGVELHEQMPEFDLLVAPIGGGGLISGVATALAELRPEVQIYGAEAEAANDTFLSLQKGERVQIPVPKTIADGMQVTSPGKLTFPIIQRLVREVVLVSEQEIVEGMRWVAEHIRQIIEPTPAVAVAAARKLATRFPGTRIAIILSGGNVDKQRYRELLAGKEV